MAGIEGEMMLFMMYLCVSCVFCFFFGTKMCVKNKNVRIYTGYVDQTQGTEIPAIIDPVVLG
jgi:hypothetical protein